MLRRLVLIRHGETVGESSVRFHGSTDVALSDEGRAHMLEAARQVRGEALDLVVASTLRRSWRAAMLLKFPRHKLADDGTRFGAGQAIVTPAIVRGETVALARQWEEAGLVENLDQFREELIVERNAGDANRVDLVIPPDIVNQARVFAGVFQYIL